MAKIDLPNNGGTIDPDALTPQMWSGLVEYVQEHEDDFKSGTQALQSFYSALRNQGVISATRSASS